MGPPDDRDRSTFAPEEPPQGTIDAPPPPYDPPPVAPDARFVTTGVFGIGGAGRVAAAVDRRLGREVARKTLRSATPSPGTVARFLREARVLARLEHPNIVPVYDLEPEGPDGPVLTMRAVRGRTLSDEVAEGRMPHLADRLRVLVRVCEAIAYAHARGVVHRDLKPQNVMLGDFGAVLVVDWGLARVLEDAEIQADLGPSGPPEARLTMVGQVAGTPGYMAPEQAAGQLANVGPAADIYALGATVHHMLTGEAPWHGVAWPTVIQRVSAGVLPPVPEPDPAPRELRAVCIRAMAARPEDRHASVDALRADLVAYLDGRPVPSVSYTRAERARRWAITHRRPLGGVVLAVLVAVAVGVIGQSLSYRTVLAAQRAEAAARAAAEASNLDGRHQLVEALLAQARQVVNTDPYGALARMMEARAAAASVGAPDPAVEASLSAFAAHSPPPLARWEIHPGRASRGVAVSASGALGMSWTARGAVYVFRLRDGVVVAKEEAEGQVAGRFDGETAIVARHRGDLLTIGPLGAAPTHRLAIPDASQTSHLRLYADGVDVFRVAWWERLERYDLDGRLVERADTELAQQRRQSGRYRFGVDRRHEKCVLDLQSGRCAPERWVEILGMDDVGYLADGPTMREYRHHGDRTPRWTAAALPATEGMFVADGALHLAWGPRDHVEVRAVADGTVRAVWAVPDPVAAAELPDQGLVVVTGRDGVASVWVIPDPAGHPARRSGSCDGLRVHDASGRVAAAGRGGVTVWDRLDAPPSWSAEIDALECRSPTFSPSGDRLAVHCHQRGLWIFDLSGRTAPIEIAAEGGPRSAPLFFDEEHLWAWRSDGARCTISAVDGTILACEADHVAAPWSSTLLPEGTRISSGRNLSDRSLHVTPVGGPTREIPLEVVPFGVAGDTSTGRYWVASEDGTLVARTPTDVAPVAQIRAHDDLVFHIDAAQGRVISGSYGGVLRVHDQGGRILMEASRPGAGVFGVDLDPTGTRVTWCDVTGAIETRDLALWGELEAADAAWRAHPDATAWAEVRRLRGGDPSRTLLP